MTKQSKVSRQRKLMERIELKINASTEVGKIMEEKFLSELEAEKIDDFFASLKLNNDELKDLQVVAFSRMVQAEQRLEFLRHVLTEILPDLWELKQAVQEKQGGGPKKKVSLEVATREYIEIGLEKKAFPKKDEFTERLNFIVTGSRSPDEDANFAVSQRTIDNYIKTIKIMIAELFAESIKAN